MPAAIDHVGLSVGDLDAAEGFYGSAFGFTRQLAFELKLLFNSATNPLCALTGLTHGQLCELPATRRVVGELLAEGRAVAGALGIAFEEDPEELVDTLGRANYDHKPSMLQDVLAHRPTEIGTLNEALVAQARASGVPVPVNAAVADLIRGVERSWTHGSALDAP